MIVSEADILPGGNSNLVRKDGHSIVRQTGHWSPFVHQLLQYLTANGFTQSPVFLEATTTHEKLSFCEGEVGHEPLQPYMQSDAVLVEAAQLLRRLHDLTQHFVIPPNATFFLPTADDNDHEVICHNDFAPYNCVFKDQHLIGIIDFDTAAPGKRIWDIAYAAYRFVPLMTDAHCLEAGWQSPPDRQARLRLFCDAYGLEDRSALVPTVIRRLETLIEFMRATASNLAHIPFYLEDLQYIRANDSVFCEAVVSNDPSSKE